jgi:hypothetical protein
VVDLDATLDEQLLDVAVGQAEAQTASITPMVLIFWSTNHSVYEHHHRARPDQQAGLVSLDFAP